MAFHPPRDLVGIDVMGSSSVVRESLLISISLSSPLLSDEHIISLSLREHIQRTILYMYACL